MPISARWRKLDALPARRGRDAMPGVYELANGERQTVYIGQSLKDVPNRIRQHLSKRGCTAERTTYWRYAYSRVPQADEAAHIAAYRARHGDVPLCNRAAPQLRGARRRYLERSRED